MKRGARIPGAASVTATQDAVVFEVDPAKRAGALSEQAGAQIASAAGAALKQRVPLLGVISSGGADIHDGIAALHGWGTAARAIVACSGIVPIALAITGPAVSGPALLLGLADLVAMTSDAFAYVSGPDAVRSWTGAAVSTESLGGGAVHSRLSGVAGWVTDEPLAALQDALAYLPPHNDAPAPMWPTDDPPERPTPSLRGLLPSAPNGSYDVRDLVREIVDDGELLELRARWAPNLVTCFATVDGRPIGVVANQPQAVAGTLDIESSQKGARFVDLCDSFNLPILTIVDTPGFFPSKDLEWRGMIRHGAQLAFAYAQATVPRVCLVTRKSYGGAYIVMDCKAMGNDLCLAWPTAEVAVMGARGAVAILHRRSSVDEQAARVAEYERDLLTPYVAAERGFIDAVVDPADTRAVVAGALRQLEAKREHLAPRAHSNTPL